MTKPEAPKSLSLQEWHDKITRILEQKNKSKLKPSKGN
jgi:hypothetical protein